jgi:hypothetical protein
MSGVDSYGTLFSDKYVERDILLIPPPRRNKGGVPFSYNVRITGSGNGSKQLLIHRQDAKG